MNLDDPRWMEIGKRASWFVSTAKPGNGVELMRDGNNNTYWQSDGNQPHLIDVKFNRRMRLIVRPPLSLGHLLSPSSSLLGAASVL